MVAYLTGVIVGILIAGLIIGFTARAFRKLK